MAVEGQLFLSFFAVPFALAGGYLLKATYDSRQRAGDIEGTAPTAVGELEPGDGPTTIEGTARATGDDRVTAAMLDREGLCVYTQIEERSAREIGESTGPSWETVYRDRDSVPFAIDDGTDEVPVEIPDQGATRLELEVYEAGHGEEPPEPVRRLLRGTDVDPREEVDPHKGYKQGLIEDGETVYATGEPVSDGGDIVLTGENRPGEFLLTDLPREELADQETAGVGSYVLGAVLLAVGLVGLAFIWVV